MAGGSSTGGSSPVPTKAGKAKAAADEIDEGLVLHFGKFRVHLGRVPELLLLIAVAVYVARLCVARLEISWPAAIPTGLFLARQLQRFFAWLRERPKKDA
mmetsp:Transcript_124867/g.249345  ORF Transcript_124867/g.249345 Transcript_124867/m.249345 type:complete len:100 (+) Transcript_124867:54-353(+)|eukprot:CAMPEP_0172669588 /NCGR_PEP_ID=MMETSP1074-20121228/9782_1 /TAXON_ID=2916 /ORGANISM="Ceratium fusus, Strain PA161109" /LENGTH=99 /DNA_ID=CAMNT_0013486389 /DNA_START=41 /DNA_END=340 /DNA_ORIENTATION=-